MNTLAIPLVGIHTQTLKQRSEGTYKVTVLADALQYIGTEMQCGASTIETDEGTQATGGAVFYHNYLLSKRTAN